MAYIKAEHGRGIARPLPAKRPPTFRRDPGFHNPHMEEIFGKALAGAKRRNIDPGFNRGGFAGFPHPQKPRPGFYPVGSEPWLANQPIHPSRPHIMDGGPGFPGWPGIKAALAGHVPSIQDMNPIMTGGGAPGEYSFAGDQPGMPTGNVPGYEYGGIGPGGITDFSNPQDGPFPPMPPQHPVQIPGMGPGAPRQIDPKILAMIQQMMQSRQPRTRWEGTLNPGALPPQGNRMFTPM